MLASTAIASSLNDTPIMNRASERMSLEWTPSQAIRDAEDSFTTDDSEAYMTAENPVLVFNTSMLNLSRVMGRPAMDPLPSQLSSFDRCPSSEKQLFVNKAEEACKLVCDVIAPQDGEKIFQAVKERKDDLISSDVGLQSLVAAYTEAPSKAMKTQILSIYANKFTVKELKVIHQPFEKLSDRQIKKARSHANTEGPGVLISKISQHRVRVDMSKLDHFLEFTSRPYFYQDVAFGSRKLKLDCGEELIMPNIVRTVARCTIIHQYLQFCRENDFVPVSRSTMWRVLEVQEACQRKSLRGLDNTAADGAEGFETLHKIVDELEEFGASSEWCSQAKDKLSKGKLYLKTKYREHCQKHGSECPDHCRSFALSDSTDAKFKKECNHRHNRACSDCEALKDTIDEVISSIARYSSKMNKEQEGDLQYDARAAAAKIVEWKAHIIRALIQEQCKQDTVKRLQADEMFVIIDWAMKFEAMKFREKQSEWFAKRGMNWHISSVVLKEGKESHVSSYAHLLNSCKQDWFAVLSILENLFSTIKSSHPHITKAYLRSDEAGCYHNSELVSSLYHLGKRQGIQILRYDHSEPQFGKDVCDRILCPMKAAIRRYCNEGHDIDTAHDIHVALKERPVEGTTAAVCTIQETNLTLDNKKIANVSSFHNFEFTAVGLQVWKAYDVGVGKLISWDEIIIAPQEDTGLAVEVPFFATSERLMKRQTNEASSMTDAEKPNLECPDPKCSEEFKSSEELKLHLDIMGHNFLSEDKKESLKDKLRRDWVDRFKTMSLNYIGKSSGLPSPENSDISANNVLEMGWALHKNRKGNTRFSPKVRDYLKKKFDIGQKTGKKEDPAQVAKDMRKASTPEGERMFTRDEWLTQTQVRGFFSRIAAKLRKGIPLDNCTAQDGVDDDDDDNDDDDIEEYAYDCDEQLQKGTCQAVLDEIGVTHPIMYDIYNICEMACNQQLSTFTVKMLKEICSHFELPFKARSTKTDLIRTVNEMISECGCE
jgi:hypothetical protein